MQIEREGSELTCENILYIGSKTNSTKLLGVDVLGGFFVNFLLKRKNSLLNNNWAMIRQKVPEESDSSNAPVQPFSVARL